MRHSIRAKMISTAAAVGVAAGTLGAAAPALADKGGDVARPPGPPGVPATINYHDYPTGDQCEAIGGGLKGHWLNSNTWVYNFHCDTVAGSADWRLFLYVG